MNRQKRIPVCEPLLAGREEEYVLEAVRSGWISSAGKYIPAFEEAFSRYCGAKHGIAVCNGTVALHLALVAAGVGKGAEVIMPDFTMIASAAAVAYVGARPVFVDAERETWNIDALQIEERINSRTSAIMVVHIYGHACAMDEIRKVARKYNLLIVEDAAEAHGAEYQGKRTGSLGDIAAFSFFANKIVSTGEGGMVLTNNDELAQRCRYFKNLCFPLNRDRTYLHEHVGFNYRMSNLHAALGLAQTERAELYVSARRRINSLYRERLKNLPGIIFQAEFEGCRNVYWMNGIVVDRQVNGIDRDSLMRKLSDRGIETRRFFGGMHHQPALAQYGSYKEDSFPVSDWLMKNGLYLPSGSGLTDEDIDWVCEAIETIVLKRESHT